MSSIAANLQAVRRRISGALEGQPREVRLVAVSKQRSPGEIREALAEGSTMVRIGTAIFGARSKADPLPGPLPGQRQAP